MIFTGLSVSNESHDVCCWWIKSSFFSASLTSLWRSRDDLITISNVRGRMETEDFRLMCSWHSAEVCGVVPMANKQTNSNNKTIYSIDQNMWLEETRSRKVRGDAIKKTNRCAEWNWHRLAVTMRANTSERLESQSLCSTEAEHRHLESALQHIAQAAPWASVPLCTRLHARHLRSRAHVAVSEPDRRPSGPQPCDSPHSGVSIKRVINYGRSIRSFCDNDLAWTSHLFICL